VFLSFDRMGLTISPHGPLFFPLYRAFVCSAIVPTSPQFIGIAFTVEEVYAGGYIHAWQARFRHFHTILAGARGVGLVITKYDKHSATLSEGLRRKMKRNRKVEA